MILFSKDFFRSLYIDFAKKSVLKSLLLLFITILGIASFNTVIIVTDSQFNSTENIDNKWAMVQHGANTERDLGYNQQTIEAICVAFDSNYDSIHETCNLSNKAFRDNAGFVYFGSGSNSLKLYEGVMNAVDYGGYRNFILPSFTFTPFISKYIDEFKALDEPINILSLDTFHYPDIWPSNFWQINFNQTYSGYHAGVYAAAAAFTTPEKFKDAEPDTPGKQIKFASLVGLTVTSIFNFMLGFMFGMEQVKNSDLATDNPSVELDFVGFKILSGWTNDTHGTIAKTFARNFFENDGVSVIFSIASELSLSIQSAAVEADKRHRKSDGIGGHYVIGADVDQGMLYLDEDPNFADGNSKYLTSAIIGIRSIFKKYIGIIRAGTELGKNIFVDSHMSESGEALATIPDRYKTTVPWEKAVEALGNKLDLGHSENQGMVNKINTLALLWANIIPTTPGEDSEVTAERIRVAKQKITVITRSSTDFISEISEIYSSIQV